MSTFFQNTVDSFSVYLSSNLRSLLPGVVERDGRQHAPGTGALKFGREKTASLFSRNFKRRPPPPYRLSLSRSPCRTISICQPKCVGAAAEKTVPSPGHRRRRGLNCRYGTAAAAAGWRVMYTTGARGHVTRTSACPANQPAARSSVTFDIVRGRVSRYNITFYRRRRELSVFGGA